MNLENPNLLQKAISMPALCSRDTISFKDILCTNKGSQCLYTQERPMGKCFPIIGRLTTGKDRGRVWNLVRFKVAEVTNTDILNTRNYSCQLTYIYLYNPHSHPKR